MKTTRLQHARLVTKAFSVVSNRFGIRERSAFLRRGAREGSGAGEWERAAGSGGGRHTAVANDGAGSRAQFAAAWPPPSALSLSRCALPDPRFVFCDKRPHIEKKINGHFGLRATRRVSGCGRSGTFIYSVGIALGR